LKKKSIEDGQKRNAAHIAVSFIFGILFKQIEVGRLALIGVFSGCLKHWFLKQ